MLQINEILKKHLEHDIPFEVWYSPSNRHDPLINIPISRGFEILDLDEFIRPDVKLDDLLFVDVVEYDEASFAQEVLDLYDTKWTDYTNGHETVLVLWLSEDSYHILTDPSIKSVSEICDELKGKFADVVGIRPPRVQSIYNSIDGLPYAGVVHMPITRYDKFWAEKYYLLGEDDMDDLPYDIHVNWLKDESFEDLFGSPDARILFVVLL